MTDMLVTSPTAAAAGRKKFATPPVKVACLACRASRIRCNGGHPCANCESRVRECEYKPSRRGGARIRKKKASGSPDGADKLNGANGAHADFDLVQVNQDPIPLPNYIDPGAGLAQLGDWPHDSDFIFDSLFNFDAPDIASSGDAPVKLTPEMLSQPVPMVRTYQSDSAILDAYYVFIHSYFPILPPPSGVPLDLPEPQFQNQIDDFDSTYEPTSAIALAISAVLALIPYPDDINHASPESVLFRRKYSQYLAQAAIEAIESEDEIPASSTDPSHALEFFSSKEPVRTPFHALLPPELERIVALDILSVYEYTQRGNLRKMQTRANQALLAAMGMTLGSNIRQDAFTEARSRVWWMTFLSASQACVVSGMRPAFDLRLHRYITRFPIMQADPGAFTFLLQAQDAIFASSQYVLDLKAAVEAGPNADMEKVYQTMKDVERMIEPLQTLSDSWVLKSTTTSPVDPTEEVASRSLRCIARLKLSSARVKLHRYCAFSDMPVFYGRHCDLTPRRDQGQSQPEEPQQWPSCACSALDGTGTGPSPSQHSLGILTPSDTSSSPPSAGSKSGFPFTSHQSARICLKSSLDIIHGFENLPYPNPSGLPPDPLMDVCYHGPTSAIVSPRTMPTFACCAMQSAYVLLMVHQRTRALHGGGGEMVGSLLGLLRGGLGSVLKTLENYGTAFEALGGMRDQVRIAIEKFQADTQGGSGDAIGVLNGNGGSWDAGII